MVLEFRVRDYKAIKEATVQVAGLTMVTGPNSGGKSTLVKGLRAFINNQSTDSHYRYGQHTFKYYVKVWDPKIKDFTQAMYQRANNTVCYYDNAGAPRQKVGRDPLQKIIPEFPIKFYQMKDSRFYPNIVFQGEVPLFSQVDIYELLSGMFVSVNKLLRYREQLKADFKIKNASVDSENASLGYLSGQIMQVSEALKQVDEAELTGMYKLVTEFELNLKRMAEISSEVKVLDEVIKASEDYAWSDSLDTKELETVLDTVRNSADKLEHLKTIDLYLSTNKVEFVPDIIVQQDIESYLKIEKPLDAPTEVPTVVPLTTCFQLLELDKEVEEPLDNAYSLREDLLENVVSLKRVDYLLNEESEVAKEATVFEGEMVKQREELDQISTCPLCNSKEIHIHLEGLNG